MYEEMGREIPVPANREAQEHSSRGITAELELNKLAVTKKAVSTSVQAMREITQTGRRYRF